MAHNCAGGWQSDTALGDAAQNLSSGAKAAGSEPCINRPYPPFGIDLALSRRNHPAKSAALHLMSEILDRLMVTRGLVTAMKNPQSLAGCGFKTCGAPEGTRTPASGSGGLRDIHFTTGAPPDNYNTHIAITTSRLTVAVPSSGATPLQYQHGKLLGTRSRHDVTCQSMSRALHDSHVAGPLPAEGHGTIPKEIDRTWWAARCRKLRTVVGRARSGAVLCDGIALARTRR